MREGRVETLFKELPGKSWVVIVADIHPSPPEMRIALCDAVFANGRRMTTRPAGHSEIQSRTLLKFVKRMLEARIEITAVAVLTFPEAQWVLPKNGIVADIGIKTCELVALRVFA